ncbi:chemotaxis protein [Cytobacillus depressus]|uniref:Chemotaxis protein n=1 Tax=Cytobacillus depressus TaxID=1602942 RepID=A0A6L3V5Y7_9BACI|nr:chemotaxis protein [Cytobacillus depressus]KAB2330139.1 chemotaxis protein [Cytobacillus depressus]
MKQVAVAIIHGMGNQKEDYAEKMAAKLQQMFCDKAQPFVDQTDTPLIIESVYWAKVFESGEDDLYKRLVLEENLHYKWLRRFIIHYLADAIAYQPVETTNHNYHLVHKKMGEALEGLAQKAGSDAPLCLISHSLGTVIASNYFYDLQMNKNNIRLSLNDKSPLEKGDSLALFYSMGTTLPFWSLRYDKFDRPIHIPSPKIEEFFPGLKGEWINFYDRHDLLGYPLKKISPEYERAVSEDREINAGGMLVNWNPLSHTGYLNDKDVLIPIVDGLFRVWKHINNI